MEYGKFNSAEELLKGYNELEKSFTQKCQELSSLRNELTKTPDKTNADGTNESSSPSETDAKTAAAVTPNAVPADDDAPSAVSVTASEPQLTVEQIKQYLDAHPDERDLLLDKTQPQRTLPRVMNGGGNVSMALPSRPKTLSEASAMAQKLFGGV